MSNTQSRSWCFITLRRKVQCSFSFFTSLINPWSVPGAVWAPAASSAPGLHGAAAISTGSSPLLSVTAAQSSHLVPAPFLYEYLSHFFFFICSSCSQLVLFLFKKRKKSHVQESDRAVRVILTGVAAEHPQPNKAAGVITPCWGLNHICHVHIPVPTEGSLLFPLIISRLPASSYHYESKFLSWVQAAL